MSNKLPLPLSSPRSSFWALKLVTSHGVISKWLAAAFVDVAKQRAVFYSERGEILAFFSRVRFEVQAHTHIFCLLFFR